MTQVDVHMAEEGPEDGAPEPLIEEVQDEPMEGDRTLRHVFICWS